jgi:hypothetical protein
LSSAVPVRLPRPDVDLSAGSCVNAVPPPSVAPSVHLVVRVAIAASYSESHLAVFAPSSFPLALDAPFDAPPSLIPAAHALASRLPVLSTRSTIFLNSSHSTASSYSDSVDLRPYAAARPRPYDPNETTRSSSPAPSKPSSPSPTAPSARPQSSSLTRSADPSKALTHIVIIELPVKALLPTSPPASHTLALPRPRPDRSLVQTARALDRAAALLTALSPSRTLGGMLCPFTAAPRRRRTYRRHSTKKGRPTPLHP